MANYKDFEEFMCNAHHHGMGFKVYTGGTGLSELDQLKNVVSDHEVIRIAPAIIGSGGVLRIFLGAALIAAGVVAAYFGQGQIAAGLISAGIGLVIGGVATLLTSPPKIDGNSNQDKKTSYLFNGPVNSTIQGGSVAVGYGRLIIGSVVISAGIETHEAS